MSLVIDRVEEKGLRHYVAKFKNKEYKGISATTLVGLFDPKLWLKPWVRRLGEQALENVDTSSFSTEELETEVTRLGEIATNKVITDASTLGTAWHTKVEDYLVGKPVDLSPKPELNTFLKYVKVYKHKDFPDGIGSEVPLLYTDANGYCVGGTTDAVFTFKTTDLEVYKTKEKLVEEKILVVADWKFPSKPKYADNCLGYFIQLAIYRASLKFTYNVKLNNALLVISPHSTDKLYLTLLDETTLDYYFDVFEKMLWLYNNDLVSLFNWDDFAKETKEQNLHGTRLVLTK